MKNDKMIEMVDSTEAARKCLENEKNELGSYDKLADKYKVNIRYIWEFIKLGTIPSPLKVCNKLGIPCLPSPKLLSTRARREKLNRIARMWHHENWSDYETQTIRDFEKSELI